MGTCALCVDAFSVNKLVHLILNILEVVDDHRVGIYILAVVQVLRVFAFFDNCFQVCCALNAQILECGGVLRSLQKLVSVISIDARSH